MEPNRNVLEIEKVKGEFFFVVLNGGAIAAVDLGPASRARFDDPALAVIGNPFQAFLFLIRNEGPWPDEMHIPTENIDDLRQLIHTGAPQPPADASEAAISRLRGARVVISVGAKHHCAELVEHEKFAILPNALLLEDHRTNRV